MQGHCQDKRRRPDWPFTDCFCVRREIKIDQKTFRSPSVFFGSSRAIFRGFPLLIIPDAFGFNLMDCERATVTPIRPDALARCQTCP